MRHFFKTIDFQLIVLILLSISLFAFAKKRNNYRKISNYIIKFDKNKGKNGEKENFFIDYEIVNKLLIENKYDTLNVVNKTLDLEIIESMFDNHPMIEKSEVYKNIDGVVVLKLKQKTPIARVFRNNESYYLCKNKSKMPLSDINTERLLIVTGKIYNSQKDSLYFLLNKVNEDKVLKENLISIEMLQDKSLILKNRVYDYNIKFGKLEETEKKLMNYKIFIIKLAKTGKLEKYKNINLSFSKQVICTE